MPLKPGRLGCLLAQTRRAPQNAAVALLRTAVITIGAAGLVILVAVALYLAPLWTGPSLPDGATRLQIVTEGPHLTFGCATALLAPVRIATSDDDLILVSLSSGEPIPVVWPSGFGAWRVGGRAVLAGPYGDVIGRDGDVLDRLGGGSGADDLFHVCPLGLSGQGGQPVWLLLALSFALSIVIVAVPRALWKRRRTPGRDQAR